MKRIYYLFLVLSLLYLNTGCDSEDADDCIQAAGAIVSQEVVVAPFTKIRIEHDVKLLLKQGPQNVVVQTGENLLNDVEVLVEEGVLVARDRNYCNFVRDYGLTQIIVTAPDIREIRNASSFEVASEGVLSYPNLSLVSNTSIVGVERLKKNGDFLLDVNCEVLTIRANGKGLFKIKGTADLLDVRFDDEAPRLEAEALIADDVLVFHRAANKMIVNPQNSLKGIITGTGDVISINRPPVVEVEERYTGRLIFKN